MYVANAAGGMTYCTILPDGSLSNCGVTATGFNTFGMVVGFGNIYVSDNSGFVRRCAFDTDGSLSSCAATGNGLSFSGGLSLTGNLLYVVSGNPAAPGVNVCPVNLDGTLSNCAAAALPAGASPITVLVVGNHAYMGDASAGIYLCTLSAVDGSLSNCTVSTGGASYLLPSQIAIY